MEETPIARVLLIDDEQSIGQGITDLLKLYGYEAFYRQNAKGGLEFLQQNPQMDIVLLDINLGDGENGLEVLPVIHEKFRFVQIFMLTSHDSLDMGLEAMKKGAFDYLTKPFQEDRFFERVPAALERRKILQLNDLYLNILVHDLKNPLQTIMVAVSSFQMFGQGSLSEKQERALQTAHLGIRQIQSMVHNILNVSKFEHGSLLARKSQFPLKHTVEQCLRVFTGVAGISQTLEVKYNRLEDKVVNNDQEFFLQVLWNLTSNAFRFSPRGGTVTIAFSEPSEGVLQTSVTNTGSFIEESQREKVFDKFAQADDSVKESTQNFGLGLTYSKLAVGTMGGRIWIEGNAAVPETTFYFTLQEN